MGQKVNPIGFRLGVIRSWDSKWYEEKNYARWLHEDIKLREYVKKKLGQAGISRVEIERAANKVKVNVHTARPGIVIGKRGALFHVSELREGGAHLLAADEVRHDPHLAGRDAEVFELGSRFHLVPHFCAGAAGAAAAGVGAPGMAGGAPGAPGFTAFLSPVCPWKVRVGANSPSLCPTMFSVTNTGTCLRPL